jgi:MFS family permease
MTQSKLWTKNFISISFSNFFLFMTFYFLLVTLPIFSLQELHTNATGAGLMTTVFLISAIISRPIAGKWIEKSGPRNVLFTALLVFFGASLFYFIPKTMSSFLMVRFLHGIGFGMATTVAGAIVANIIPTSRRGEGMGYFIMSTNLAMVLGPFIGLTTIQEWGPNVLFLISAVGALAALLTGLNVKIPKREIVQNAPRVPFSFKQYFEVSAIPISIVGAFFAIIYSSILSFVSVYADQIHLGHVSSFFFVVYAIVLLISRPFTGKWFDKRGENVIIFPSIILFAVGMFVLSKSVGASSFLLSAGMIGLGWGTIFPTLQTIAIQDVPPKKRGLATATFLSIYDTGIGFGSFIVGVIVSKISFGSFYMLSAFYLLIGVVIYYILHTRKQPEREKGKEQELA